MLARGGRGVSCLVEQGNKDTARGGEHGLSSCRLPLRSLVGDHLGVCLRIDDCNAACSGVVAQLDRRRNEDVELSR